MTDHRTDRNPAAPDSGGARELAEALCPPHHREGWASSITHEDGTHTFKASERRPCTLHFSQANALLASPQFARLIDAAKGEAWDEGWRAHMDYLAAVTVWNASEGAETPDALHARNPHRAALTTEAAQ